MSSYFDKLNLRPQERRLVVAVAIAFFVVLNMWLVWPRFKDWGETEMKMNRSRLALRKYEEEIAKKATYENKLKELQSSGSQFLTDELQLSRIVQNHAKETELVINNLRPRSATTGSKTNQFFQELDVDVNFTSGGKELVDFLVSLAAENSMIRVRGFDVSPEASQTRLKGNLMLVANLQKRAAAAPVKVTSAPGSARPGATNKTAPLVKSPPAGGKPTVLPAGQPAGSASKGGTNLTRAPKPTVKTHTNAVSPTASFPKPPPLTGRSGLPKTTVTKTTNQPPKGALAPK